MTSGLETAGPVLEGKDKEVNKERKKEASRKDKQTVHIHIYAPKSTSESRVNWALEQHGADCQDTCCLTFNNKYWQLQITFWLSKAIYSANTFNRKVV